MSRPRRRFITAVQNVCRRSAALVNVVSPHQVTRRRRANPLTRSFVRSGWLGAASSRRAGPAPIHRLTAAERSSAVASQMSDVTVLRL